LKFGKPDSKWWRVNYSQFFDWMTNKLNIKTAKEWYSVDAAVIQSMGGPAAKASSKYLHQYLKSKFPDIEWEAWRFKLSSRHNLPDAAADRKFFDHVATALGFENLSGWYRITKTDLEAIGGTQISLKYKDRLKLLEGLRVAYPEHVFYEWLFDPAPRSWWKSPENQRTFFEHLFKKLELRSMQEWYSVEKDTVQREGGPFKV
jgi:hypothetical protein